MDSPDSEGSPGEVIYGSNDETSVAMSAMSDMVQSMASSIYGEFERMIKAYGDSVVEGLMPQLVAVLENWDRTIREKQDIQLELDLTREDNEQLLNQYEREKQLRRSTEQNSLEVQDSIDEQRKELDIKLEGLERNYKVLEIKSKNYQDQVQRLEEKEGDIKREYDKLHSRYTELFRTHMDYVERTKVLIGPEKTDNSTDGSLLSGGVEALKPVASASTATSGRSRMQPANADSMLDAGNGFANPLMVDDSSRNGEDRSQQHRAEGDLQREAVHIAGTPADGSGKRNASGTGLLSRMSMEAAAAGLIVDELEPEMEGSDGGVDDALSQLTGMTREVENLIKENQELIQMKNALSIVKDDLISRLDEATAELEMARAEQASIRASSERHRVRITELEDDVKKLRESAASSARVASGGDEEDTPSSQRKRFTRAEMARCIMERNQYKERLMELQEAVRWTEMIRASREHIDSATKKKSNIWNFFSNLFATPTKQKRLAAPSLHYNAPATHVRPIGDPNRPRRSAYDLGDRAKAYDFLQDDSLTDGARRQKEEERKEQYRRVQAHVRRDDTGRVQAYGWSVPNRLQQQQASGAVGGGGASPLTVPVPVYCRPLVSNEDAATKLCCAAAVLPALGRTRDGGSVIGSSIFYSPADDAEAKTGSGDSMGETAQGASEELSAGVAELSLELTEHQKALAEAEKRGQRRSSLVWICTATAAGSKVVVIDASNPAECLESFAIPGQRAMTIACIPGASDKDYPAADSHCAELVDKPEVSLPRLAQPAHPLLASDEDAVVEPRLVFVSATGAHRSSSDSSTGTASGATTSDTASSLVDQPSVDSVPTIDEDLAAIASKMVLPTMWIATESGWLYIYAATTGTAGDGHATRCLRSAKLSSCGLCITHAKGKVFVGLGDGTTAIFHRNSDGSWCTGDYHLLDFGDRGTAVRCCTSVADSKVWLGFKNCVYVVDTDTLQIATKIEAHPRKESQVRLLSWAGGDGVWVSIRLDSTLRLFHAYTHERLQDIDVEPYVDKMLGAGKLGFSFSRVTALDISCGRLWIGTGNGVIISLPLADGTTKEPESRGVSRQILPAALSAAMPGGAVRIYCDSKTDRVTPASYIPFCCSSLAQLSFHGHRDAVKFFVTVSSASTASSLVMSGGEGYIDFRVGDDDEGSRSDAVSAATAAPPEDVPPRMWSHLIVWEVAAASSCR